MAAHRPGGTFTAEIKRNARKRFYWVAEHQNGDKIGMSSQGNGYARRQSAQHAFENFMAAWAEGRITVKLSPFRTYQSPRAKGPATKKGEKRG